MTRYFYRLPATTNERRQFYASPFALVRPARRPMTLPTAWDDYGGCRQRTWKVFGKKPRQHGYNQMAIREFKRGTAFGEEPDAVPLF